MFSLLCFTLTSVCVKCAWCLCDNLMFSLFHSDVSVLNARDVLVIIWCFDCCVSLWRQCVKCAWCPSEIWRFDCCVSLWLTTRLPMHQAHVTFTSASWKYLHIFRVFRPTPTGMHLKFGPGCSTLTLNFDIWTWDKKIKKNIVGVGVTVSVGVWALSWLWMERRCM